MLVHMVRDQRNMPKEGRQFFRNETERERTYDNFYTSIY